MKLLFFFSIIISLSFSVVIKLDRTGLDKVLKENQFVFIMFTQKQQNYYQAIEEEFEMISDLYQTLPNGIKITFVEMIKSDNEPLQQQYKLRGTPYFKFIANSGALDQPYGGNSLHSALNFALKKILGNVQEVSTVEEFEIEKQRHHAMVIFFGQKKSNEFTKIFEMLAKRFDLAYFILIKPDTEAYQNLYKGDKILMTRFFGNETIAFSEELNVKNLEFWLTKSVVPSPFFYGNQFEAQVLQYKFPTLIFQREKTILNEQREEKYRQIVQEIRQEHKEFDGILMGINDYLNPVQKRLCDIIGIFERSQMPVLVFIVLQEQANNYHIHFFNYKNIDDAMTKEAIVTFLSNYINGTLHQYLQSETNMNSISKSSYYPSDIASIYFIQGKEAYSQLFSDFPDKDILVLYYADYCHKSQEYFHHFQSYAEKVIVEDMHYHLMFAAIDVAKNDIGWKKLPEIWLYRRDKREEPLKFTGDLTRSTIEKWASPKMSHPHDEGKQQVEFQEKKSADFRDEEL